MRGTNPDEPSAYARTKARRVVVVLAVVAGLITAATAALWFHYGTAVFYETILAGLNACF
jgi:hypothetical protein